MAGSKAGGGISRMAMKAMGIFGGVQVMTILCSIVRTKLVALWIGPVGVGLFGLMNNALEMLNTATNLGVRNSSVRDISQAAGGHDRSLVGRIIAVVRRWSLWLGLGGALLTVAVAPLLSDVTFGDQEHVWSFVALSAAVLLMALTNGEQAVLQGTARLKRLAQVTLWGNVCGLAVSVPLFYWLRQDSILPSILAYALAMAVWAWVLRSRDYAPVRVDRRTTAAVGAGFVKHFLSLFLGGLLRLLSGSLRVRSYDLRLVCLALNFGKGRVFGLLYDFVGFGLSVGQHVLLFDFPILFELFRLAPKVVGGGACVFRLGFFHDFLHNRSVVAVKL